MWNIKKKLSILPEQQMTVPKSLRVSHFILNKGIIAVYYNLSLVFVVWAMLRSKEAAALLKRNPIWEQTGVLKAKKKTGKPDQFWKKISKNEQNV